jgi:hypothetical protein
MISSVPFTAVRLADKFWRPRLEINRTVTLPFVLKQCAGTGRTDNFVKAAGRMAGTHEGYYFNDSDVYKALEGAAYSLHTHPDPALERTVDEWIALIAAAQEEDGYLYTARTIDPEAVTAEREGLRRWSNLPVNHELYNVGHLYEAAVAHYRATGKRTLLDVALKNADLIAGVFGENGRHDVPGHEEIEIGLVKLYQVTGETKYWQLAQFFLDERGRHDRRAFSHVASRGAYAQDHQPVIEQREAVGHAVRAAYLYTGMADVAALTDHQGYLSALQAIWQDVVAHKLHLTGGIGARHEGEAFGDAYELPMPVQRVLCHQQVAANRGRVALERGPLVYCVEGVDNGRLADLLLPDDAALTAEHQPDLLGGVTVIRGEGKRPFLAIPYYAWANRGAGEMAVWLPGGVGER